MKSISISRQYVALWAVALALAVIAPLGCSSGDDVVEGPSDGDTDLTDGDTDPVEIDVADPDDQIVDGDKDDDVDEAEPFEPDSEGPFIQCPTTISMGFVTIGDPVERTFTCQNIGTEPLSVYEITMTQGAREEFTLINPPPPARNVPLQGTFSQKITYDPVDPGKDCATVTVVSNAVNDATYTIEVCSEYKGDPAIVVAPTSHDFGEVVPNSTPLTRTITISNPQDDQEANAVLVIDHIGNESGSTADFEPVVADPFPIYINANDTYTFSIEFHPSRVTPDPLTDTIVISHNVPEVAATVVVSGRAAVPIISCSPVDDQNTINWGQIKAGTQVEKILSCENIGGSTLHIRDVTLTESTNPEFTEHDTISPTGVFLARGTPVDIYLTYSPTGLGVHQGQLVVESNDETTPQLRINLAGAAIDSRLTAIPGSVNYGEVVVGESEAQTFTLRNDGQAPVKILDLSFGENEMEFSIPVSVMQAVVNTTLNHLEAVNVEVLYSPIDAGVDSRSLEVISDDSHNPSLDVTFNGIGLAAKIGITCPEHPLFATEGIDFGEVALGMSENTDCYVTNLGTTDMNITVDITGQTPQDEFWVVQEAFLPTPPGESKILTLRYTPLLVEGEDLGQVTVYANDPLVPPLGHFPARHGGQPGHHDRSHHQRGPALRFPDAPGGLPDLHALLYFQYRHHGRSGDLFRRVHRNLRRRIPLRTHRAAAPDHHPRRQQIAGHCVPPPGGRLLCGAGPDYQQRPGRAGIHHLPDRPGRILPRRLVGHRRQSHQRTFGRRLRIPLRSQRSPLRNMRQHRQRLQRHHRSPRRYRQLHAPQPLHGHV